MDLFDAAKHGLNEPLAARMRPRNLDEYIGQDHIVGKGRLLRRAIAADQLTSVIFYGPPGTGKTTLARVIANHTKSNFITLNAVLTGVQNIRDSIAQAEQFHKLYGKKTILFVDEVHRWNRSQQDALLPWVENGTIILVGATTENPFFEVNKALVSRSRVFQLKPLTEADLTKAAQMALSDKERGYGNWNVEFESGALEHLIQTANGDARSLLNALELAVETTPEKWNPNAPSPEPPFGSRIYISQETAEESIQQKVVLYDRDGDYHYDIISAFIKSIRGRDPDAALYWMARMVAAGEDPHFIFRRMLISACEDTGLADPTALGVVESCAAAFDRIGLPEGRYMLTQAVLYLATAPKSNSSMAFFDALKVVQSEDSEVPNHLRDASRDGEGFGHGAGYLYPHAYKDHWVAQQYLPEGMNGRVFYNPSDQGYEKTIREEVLSRRELQISSLLEQTAGFDDILNPMGNWGEAEHLRNGTEKKGENLTFSPGGKARDAWQKRTDSNRAQVLLDIRNTIIGLATPPRHASNLVIGADDGLLLWELWRISPEGFTAGLCRTEHGKAVLDQYGATLGDLDKPLLLAKKLDSNDFQDIIFDYVFYRDPLATSDAIPLFCKDCAELFSMPFISDKTSIFIAQKLPSKTQRLAKLLSSQRITRGTADTANIAGTADIASTGAQNGSQSNNSLATNQATNKVHLLDKMLEAENSFFTNGKISFSANDIKNELEKNDKTLCISIIEKVFTEPRFIDDSQIERWFDADNSEYGKNLLSKLGEENCSELKQLLKDEAKTKSFAWQQTVAFFRIEKKQ